MEIFAEDKKIELSECSEITIKLQEKKFRIKAYRECNVISLIGYFIDTIINQFNEFDYDPTTGRFLTEDTYRGESGDVADWHLYVYCANDPINYVDPSGHAGINIAFATIGGIVGWKLGDYVAKKLGYRKGSKYWAIRTGVTVGGAVIGWFSAKLMTKLLSNY